MPCRSNKIGTNSKPSNGNVTAVASSSGLTVRPQSLRMTCAIISAISRPTATSNQNTNATRYGKSERSGLASQMMPYTMNATIPRTNDHRRERASVSALEM